MKSVMYIRKTTNDENEGKSLSSPMQDVREMDDLLGPFFKNFGSSIFLFYRCKTEFFITRKQNYYWNSETFFPPII